MKKAFTLAEVLITITIIGIVATMTIPTIIQSYKERAWSTAATVFERKLGEALKIMNSQQTLAGYRDTLNFVNELSKHLKIIKICTNDDILSCFEDKVYWGAGEAGTSEVDMSRIKSAENFGQDDWDTETIGVQFANGTTGVIAYNPACKQDPYANNIINISKSGLGTNCLAILYDTDGYKTPNTINKDLRSINVPNLNGNLCGFELGGICFSAPFYSTPLSISECEQAKTDGAPIRDCGLNNDYWAGAVKQCNDEGGRLAAISDINEIVDYVYYPNGVSGDCNLLELDVEKAQSLGFKINPGDVEAFDLWTEKEYSATSANARPFFTHPCQAGDGIGQYDDYKGTKTSTGPMSICVYD